MMQMWHICPSRNNYASPLHVVPKKGTLEWRPARHYRALNAQTIKDKYHKHCIADFTANLRGTNIFSHIDLIKTYHEIPIHPDDIHKKLYVHHLEYLKAHACNLASGILQRHSRDLLMRLFVNYQVCTLSSTTYLLPLEFPVYIMNI